MTTNDPMMIGLSARVSAGERVSDAELAELSALDILALGTLADMARRLGSSPVTFTRVHVVTAPYVAEDFAVPPEADELRLLALPESLEETRALLTTARALLPPAASLTAFSVSDLAARAEAGWGPLESLLGELGRLGARDVAELPIDEVHDLSAALRTGRAAGLAMSRLTVSRPVGARRASLLASARAAMEQEGGVTSFGPLPTRPPGDVPTTGYDDLRTIALARLAVAHLARSPEPVSIEVDWRRYGPKLAQVALIFGADRLDGVPATSDPELGSRRETVADVERNIRAAGFEPSHAGRGSP